MNKRKQIILVIAVLLVAFCSFVYLKKQFFSPSKPKEESRKETIVYDSSLKDITLTKDGRYVLVSPNTLKWHSNNLRISQNYVVSTFITYEHFYAKKNTLPSSKLVKFDIITYDLRKKNFVEKRIDLKKAVEEYDSDYGLRDDGSLQVVGSSFYFEGKDLENKKNSENRELETARIDYVMAKKGADYKVKKSFYINDDSRDWTKLSDHLPYMAVFEVE